MKNFVYIAVSLDGFIATKDGGVAWLDEIHNPTGSDLGYREFLSNIDALLMGRNSFEKVASFPEWPYDKKVFVFSNSLKSINPGLIDKAEIVSGTLEAVLKQINDRGYRNLYIDGGKTVSSFLARNLIDEMTITTIPVLLGAGIPLFSGLKSKINLTHVSTEVCLNALVKTTYRCDRQA